MTKKVEQKKEVVLQAKEYGFYEFFKGCESIDSMIAQLEKVKQEFLEYRVLHRCDVNLLVAGSRFEVKARRVESDAEFERRLAKKQELANKRAADRAKAAEAKRKQEIELLLKLKKKYPKVETA